MSAFMLDKRHIDYLISAGLTLPGRGDTLRWLMPAPVNPAAYERGNWAGAAAADEFRARARYLRRENAEHVGAMLTAENRRSVDHRYDEEELEDWYEFLAYDRRIDPVQVLKAIACYRYQSCEHPEWQDSEANAFCNALEHAAINALPGYDAAEWEIR